MRSKLGRLLRIEFSRELERRVPSFHPDPSAVVPSGWRVFRWQSKPGLACFVVLCTDTSRDRFTVECAWSRHGRFPAETGLQNPRAWPEAGVRSDEPRDGAFRFRLGQLWRPDDYWWTLTPESEFQAQLERFTDAVIAQDAARVDESLKPFPDEEAAAMLRPATVDAVEKIADHALPYFEEIIAGV